MTEDPTTTAAAVKSMGRKRTIPASTTASSSGIPSANFKSMKSTRMIEFLTTMPAPAIKPIMDVAVKKAPIIACPGIMPIRESGMGAIMTSGIVKDLNHATTIT